MRRARGRHARRERFPIKFYLVCMIFILLDVDAAFLYPWALIFRELGVVRLRRDARLRHAPGRRVRLRVEGRSPRLVDMQFTPENKASFDAIVSRYPVKRSALLPALHLLQEQEGWLTHGGHRVRWPRCWT